MSELLCPVRGCGLVLAREPKRVVCPRAHSFDIARTGYINLLQPQDRRSKDPGDSAAAVLARRRLHERGVTRPLLRGIADVAGVSSGDLLLDAGCGDGYYPGMLAAGSGCTAQGVDISVSAIEAAARAYPNCEWIVANADRLIPYAPKSFSLVLSVTGRMNPAEFRRVIEPGGRLLVAVASPEDLIELRGVGRDRAERTVAEFAPHFRLTARERVTARAELDKAGVEDVLLSIYRPMRSEPVDGMSVTFSLDLLLFHLIDTA